MTFQVNSPKSIEHIAQKVAELSKEKGFSVMHSYNFFDILQSKGFPITRNAMVFEICQPGMASRMLTHFPAFSAFLPCRIALHEENQQTVISTMDMDPLLEQLKENAEVFQEAYRLFDDLKVLMRQLAEA